MDDTNRLHEYAAHGSEAAFAALVRSHAGLVYSVALRTVGNTALAEDVAQAVFLLLARKAGSLRRETVLAAWLFKTTRYVASRAVRSELRRLRRETEACQMNELRADDTSWKTLTPLVDEAVEALSATDREVILLRFYEGKNHREIGLTTGLAEEAAKKRVQRALEKLRGFLARRGIVASVVVLAALLEENATQAAPLAGINTWASGKAAGAALEAAKMAEATLAAWRRIRLIISIGTAVLVCGVVAGWRLATAVEGRRDAQAVAGENRVPDPGATQTEVTVPGTKVRAAAARSFRLLVAESETGRPIPDAEIRLSWVLPGHLPWLERSGLSTDAQGAVSIPVAPGTLRLDIGVLKQGFAQRFYTWREDSGRPLPAQYQLKLEPAEVLSGTVTDQRGRPVEGATIAMFFRGTGDYSERETPTERLGYLNPREVARSDEKGRWWSANVPPSCEAFVLTIKQDRFPSASFEAQDYREAMRKGAAVFILKDGVRFGGLVVDGEGHPIAGARIRRGFTPEFVTADDDGQFALFLPKDNPPRLSINADGFAPGEATLAPPGAAGTQRFVLNPGRRLRFRVFDGEGQPLAGAQIEPMRQGDLWVEWVGTSDADGRIVWDTAPPEKGLRFSLSAAGFQQKQITEESAAGEEQVINLGRLVTVVGEVIDGENGAPVPEFAVIPGYYTGDLRFIYSATLHATHGHFQLPMDQDHPVAVKIEAKGYESKVQALPRLRDSTVRSDFILKRSALDQPVHGQVINPDGTPAADSRVAILTLEGTVTLDDQGLRTDSRVGVIPVDGEGRFRSSFEPLAHGVVALADAGFVRVRVRDFHQPLTLRLQPWGRLEDTVDDPEGVAVGDRVQLSEAWQEGGASGWRVIRETRVAPGGRYTFEKMPEGIYRAWLGASSTHASRLLGSVSIRPQATVRVVRNTVGTRVQGRLTLGSETVLPDWARAIRLSRIVGKKSPMPDPGGDTALDLAAWHRWADWADSAAQRNRLLQVVRPELRIGSDGHFESESLAPGEYELQVVFDPEATPGRVLPNLERSVSVPEGSEEKVDLGAVFVQPSFRPR